MAWTKPSERTAELIRACVNRLLESAEEIFEAVDDASIPDEVSGATADPVLLRNYRRVNRATVLQWAEANLRDPGCEVPPYSGSEIDSLTRDLVRRGLDTNALEPYRSGQNVTWQKWMETAFAETDDPAELQDLLEVSARSIFAYVDATMMATAARIQEEREEFNQTGAERLETVVLVLEETPIDLGYAAARLNYGFDGDQLSAIIWSDGEVDLEKLEAAADRLRKAAGSGPALTVHASSAALWTWVKPTVDLAAIAGGLEAADGVRFALGSPLPGIDGFRRTHADASETQRLVTRLGSELAVARYDEMKVVALLAHDQVRAGRLVSETLGELREAPGVLRETVRSYLANQSNATRTAAAMYAHRNTVLARIQKAEELLPAPLSENVLAVSAALEILYWQRGQQGRPADAVPSR
jgi:DNA-binding PucR family transcriptional regulator